MNTPSIREHQQFKKYRTQGFVFIILATVCAILIPSLAPALWPWSTLFYAIGAFTFVLAMFSFMYASTHDPSSPTDEHNDAP